jgi:multidrug efflux pump subunit AcrA (membrane-fusion protein)
MTREIAFLFVASLSASGCGLHGRPKVSRKVPASPVAAAQAELQEPSRVVAPGLVESWGGDVSLSPQEAGQIAQLLVEEGQRVEAGQLLAVLDDSAQRAAVEVARADVGEASAAYAKTLNGATPEELRKARAEAQADDARAAFARSNARRMDFLGETQAVAPAEVQRANSDAQSQSALAQASAARLGSIARGARAEDRAGARARLAAARARLQSAEAALARRRVLAPKGASVLLSQFHVGEFFTPGGAPLFVLGDVSRLRVRLEVDEIDAMRLMEGAPCTIYGDDSIRIIDGTVFRVAPRMGRRGLAIESPTARADVRVREVFIEVPATSALIPGQRVWGHTTPRVALASLPIQGVPRQ